GALVYDDYAHNPAKIRAFISALREKYPDKRIILLFQPHLASRTKSLFAEFTASFDNVEEILIAPIFLARETPDPEINSEKLADALRMRGKTAWAFASLEELAENVRGKFRAGDIVATVGAGDIYTIIPRIID
ncbi:MAG TPA: cyanophycin synthetase, partial [Patescibacteria group bacterium]|nr:cyanophycin synthetase [Patescibacteria group bacterium]